MKGEFPRIPSGCAVAGIMNEDRKSMGGKAIVDMIRSMHNRTNGLGGGFTGYGIYPERKEYYAIHMMYEDKKAKARAESKLEHQFEIVHDEAIPVRETSKITLEDAPILWRYFASVPSERLKNISEQDYVVQKVIDINSNLAGAYVSSCGKNMGVFKGVGYPGDIGDFYRLEEYQGYCWVSHGRFPTNSAAWWGGAHPFSLLNWSVVHNGEISSYGTNKRYLENRGYKCTMETDTEVVTYALDLLHRKHKLPMYLACKCLSPPLWDEIDKYPENEKQLYTTLRRTYESLLLNGPFAVIMSNGKTMIGLNDRIKLRPMVAARDGKTVIMSSEESAIRSVYENIDSVWMLKAGEPSVARLEEY